MSLTKVSYSMIRGTPLNVLDFGADPKNVHDSSPAIQAAIDRAQLTGEVVYIPDGNFKINTTLTINSQAGVRIVGEHRPSVYNGTNLFYNGTDYAFRIKNASGTFIYHVDFDQFAIHFTQAALGAIYAENIQESNFTNLFLEGIPAPTLTALAVFYGMHMNGMSITNIDNCRISYFQRAIYIPSYAGAGANASGSSNITRNNIFCNYDAITVHLIYGMNINFNWLEWFENGVLLANSGVTTNLTVYYINIMQNWFSKAEATSNSRALRVQDVDPNKPIRAVINFDNNYCYMQWANELTSIVPYAVSFELDPVNPFTLITATLNNNIFYGVTTAGILVNDRRITVYESGNITRQNFSDIILPNIFTPYSYLTLSYTLYRVSGSTPVPATTDETVLATFYIPNNLLGKTGSIRVTSIWTCSNNANGKIVRARFDGVSGFKLMEASVTSADGGTVTNIMTNRNATNSQTQSWTGTLNSGTGVGGIYFTSYETSFTNVPIVITGQKNVAGDNLILETLLVEAFPG